MLESIGAKRHNEESQSAFAGYLEMMMRIVVGGLLAALLLVTPAQAFQESQIGGAPTAEGAADVVPSFNSDDPVARFSEGATDEEEGTEVRLPGLGKLGVIPKLDFGLELLYGATDTEGSGEGLGQEGLGQPLDNDDVMIRGRLKHKF